MYLTAVRVAMFHETFCLLLTSAYVYVRILWYYSVLLYNLFFTTGLGHKSLEAAGSSDRYVAAYITWSTHSSCEHRQHVGDFGSFTYIISIQTAFFFQLPTPTCQSCSDFSHCPSALNSRSHLRPYPPCHHWLVGSVTWHFKVPTAYNNMSHSHGHWN